MKLTLLWIAAMVVALAELGILILMLVPRVDPTYRAYFIDRSSDCWPHRTDAHYSLGAPLSFVNGKGTDFAPNKICGWFYPEAAGTWSYGSYSLLRFKFTPEPGPLTLTFAAGALVNEDHPVQHVVVSANNVPVGTLAFSAAEPAEKTLALPAGAGATGQVELRFDYPDAVSGRVLGPNEDSHLRAIRMKSLTLGKG